jgi:hypothetical protein
MGFLVFSPSKLWFSTMLSEKPNILHPLTFLVKILNNLSLLFSN